MNLYIKNMVCPRCILTVKQILERNGLDFDDIRLGEVTLKEALQSQQKAQLARDLEQVGFELLDDHRKQLIEKIKSLIIQKVQDGDIEEHFSISKFLSSSVFKDYSYISKLFTEVEGITIEQFFILQKIEKVKEWLVYNEMSLNDICSRLGYSSIQHLSTQFKKLTGITPSAFRKLGINLRKPIDGLGKAN